MKKVLILGAGLVSKPMVEYLLREGFEVTIATRTKEKADRLLGGHENGRSVAWMTDDMESLDRMVKEHNSKIGIILKIETRKGFDNLCSFLLEVFCFTYQEGPG